MGGGEFFQVFRLDRSTGRSELLTDGKSRHEGLKVSKDGKWLTYSSTARNGKDTDVYVAPTDNPRQARRVTEVEGTWFPGGLLSGRLEAARHASSARWPTRTCTWWT